MIIAENRIPVAGPSITDREVELAAEAARTVWFQNHPTISTIAKEVSNCAVRTDRSVRFGGEKIGAEYFESDDIGLL
jgi:hypothetical protein